MNSRRLMVTTALVLLSTAWLAAQDVSGRWTAKFTTQVGEQEYTFDFVQKGTQLTGTATGNLLGKSTITDGKVEGEIHSPGVLTVGENAEIRGEIKTKSVTVFGKVHGNITVEERCELKSRAVLQGDLKAARLVIEEGATFVGKSEVTPNKIQMKPEIVRNPDQKQQAQGGR